MITILFLTLSFAAPSAWADHTPVPRHGFIGKAKLNQKARTLQKENKEFAQSLQRGNLRRGLRRDLAVFTASVEHLIQTTSRSNPRRPVLRAFKNVKANFLKLRRKFHRKMRRPGERVLNAWYDVAFAFEKLDRKMAQFPKLISRPEIRPSMAFTGKINNTDVFFSGVSHDALNARCVGFLKTSISSVRSLEIRGTTHRKKFGAWTIERACALVSLNAKVQNGPAKARLNAQIARTPIRAQALNQRALRVALKTLIPRAAPRGARRVSIGSKAYKKRHGRWTPDAIVAIFLNEASSQKKSLVSRGTLDDTPFSFGGMNRQELRKKCLSFFAAVSNSQGVRSISVNGVDRRAKGGFWKPNEACMIVSSLAKSA